MKITIRRSDTLSRWQRQVAKKRRKAVVDHLRDKAKDEVGVGPHYDDPKMARAWSLAANLLEKYGGD